MPLLHVAVSDLVQFRIGVDDFVFPSLFLLIMFLNSPLLLSNRFPLTAFRDPFLFLSRPFIQLAESVGFGPIDRQATLEPFLHMLRPETASFVRRGPFMSPQPLDCRLGISELLFLLVIRLDRTV